MKYDTKYKPYETIYGYAYNPASYDIKFNWIEVITITLCASFLVSFVLYGLALFINPILNLWS